jgi:hypothetical protein
VRGCGGGGAGGGSALTNGTQVAAGSGGNSGVSIEVEINPGVPLTGGAYVVGAGGVGIAGGNGLVGASSTLVIGGTTLTAPGGSGGIGGAASTSVNLSAVPLLVPTNGQTSFTSGVDYQACDNGSFGLIVSTVTTGGYTGGQGGNGGSGDYGVGGAGANFGVALPGNGSGSGAGGGGSVSPNGTPANQAGGHGAPGIWIIEEYS